MPSDREGPNEFRVPFIFVPHGHPEPKEWMARHPGWVKFPAVMVPRAELDQQPASPAAAWPPAVPAPMPASLPMQGPVAEVAAVPETLPASELLIDGMAAEAIPPEYRDPQFDVAAFDPIGALRAIQPVLDDPAAAAGLRPPRTAPGPNPGLFTPVQARKAAVRLKNSPIQPRSFGSRRTIHPSGPFANWTQPIRSDRPCPAPIGCRATKLSGLSIRRRPESLPNGFWTL